MWKYCCLAALAGACALAADRPDLTGTWHLDTEHSQVAESHKAETWSITQKPESIEIVQAFTDSGGKERKIQIHCSTMGQECKVDEAGQPTQVTMYYNGPVLVMLEQWHGTNFVTKKRLKTSDDGKTLVVEVNHIAPPRKDENWTFLKQ